MTDRLFASTRKGLFEFRRKNNEWSLANISFLGSPVTGLLMHPGDGALYATLDLGHFGVKLHESRDGGKSWEEIATPSYAGIDPQAKDRPASSCCGSWKRAAAISQGGYGRARSRADCSRATTGAAAGA